MFWIYFGYWMTVGVVSIIICCCIEFISSGKFEIKISDIPIAILAVVIWPLILLAAIGHIFEKYGDKPILKITRKEKK